MRSWEGDGIGYMTWVIAEAPETSYPARMEQVPPHAVLVDLLREHRVLEDGMRELDPTPGLVLAVGQTLLAFARQEDEAFSALNRLLEPAVLDEMRAEHEEISRDLELLDWLVCSTPDSPDAAVLAASIASRMLRHVSRDGRLLARATGVRFG
jgi:hypothetical protein